MRRVGGALEKLLALRVNTDLQTLFLGRAHVLTMAVHRFGVNTYATAVAAAASNTPNAAFTATIAAASILLCR